MMWAMDLTVRLLTDDDVPAGRQLGSEAFGVSSQPPTAPPPANQDGRSWFGVFDGETLVAQMIDREYDSFYGGVALPTSGIAAVAVAVEHRGRGVLTPLFASTLVHARERGAVISTLFPTAPRIYRRFGYELIADYDTVELPTAVLPASTGEAMRTRRATASDFDAIRRVYDAWASGQNGPLTRRGPSFTTAGEEFIASFTGVTVAVGADDVVRGFASWDRGQGYGDKAVLEVSDLLAADASGYRALLAAMRSFASVTPRVRIDTSGDDVIRLFVDSTDWRVVSSSPYMLKVIDVGAALSLRGYPPDFAAELSFALAEDFLAENDGSYVLEIADGRGACRRVGTAERTFTPRGLAMMFAGTQSSANLRSAGHLSGGIAQEDDVWDAVFGGRQAHIRDYF